MIAGIMHKGSGIGNQLHRYVAARVLAEDKGFSFGMVAPENFKASFITVDLGNRVDCAWTLAEGGKVIPISSMASFEEKKVLENGVDIRGYDPEWNFVQDNTIIDGEFQDERYFIHRLPDIRKWLRTEFVAFPDNLCILGFRGGEYKAFPDLFLTRDYWDKAIEIMKQERPDMKFAVVTDDVEEAKRWFPDYNVYHDERMDWLMVRGAKYVVVSNSSFYILPALLSERRGKIIAPKYWARRNTGTWATNQNYYSKFTYI